MSGQVQGTSKRDLGSSPRRLIKRTHDRNPTFHSFNLFGVLQPDPASQNLPSEPTRIKYLARPTYSFNSLLGVDVSPHKKESFESYLPSHGNQYLAENGQKSLSRVEPMENSKFGVRSKSTNKMEVDSLHAAEDEFKRNKLRNPEYFISGSSFKGEEKTRQRLVMDFSPSQNRQSSMKRCRSIVDRQRVDYNIISHITRV